MRADDLRAASACLLISCPTCEVGPGEACLDYRGHRTGVPHRGRRDAARARATPSAVPPAPAAGEALPVRICPVCGPGCVAAGHPRWEMRCFGGDRCPLLDDDPPMCTDAIAAACGRAVARRAIGGGSREDE